MIASGVRKTSGPIGGRPCCNAQGTTISGVFGRAAMLQYSPSRPLSEKVTVSPVPASGCATLGANAKSGAPFAPEPPVHSLR